MEHEDLTPSRTICESPNFGFAFPFGSKEQLHTESTYVFLLPRVGHQDLCHRRSKIPILPVEFSLPLDAVNAYGISFRCF